MRRVQVFDVNETLLDQAAMDPHFRRIFGDAGVRVTWFSQMIQSALVATVTGAYRPFGAHAMAALEMTAEQAGVTLADGDREAVADQLRHLPAHPEVAGALRRLGDAGLRLASLTNSTEEVARAARAGCATAFVARPGKVLDPLVERPGIVGDDLAEVAEAILAVEREDGGRP
jgi:2-haloacid dehalogenase